VVRSGWVSSLGPYVKRFEQSFAEYVGASHAVAVANGTVALHLALHALGIGPGDEVIVPDLTFVATANAVLYTGAKPVLVDVEPDTWCIDPIAVQTAITARTRAIVPVHLYGHPADMAAILRLADVHGLVVIEDAAEAHGARLGGRRVGTLGRAGTFSFYGNKIMTTGEGGMLTTNDAHLADRLRYLADHAMSPTERYYHSELAFNYRLTSLQAALGVAQLEQIDEFVEKKRAIYRWYADGLAGLPSVQLNFERPNSYNVYWMSCLVLTERSRIGRQELMQALRQRSIDSRPFFVPLHRLPHLAGYRAVGCDGEGCPRTEWLAARGLNLPSGCSLNEETVRYVVSRIVEILS
jgi:perosamine synthetase